MKTSEHGSDRDRLGGIDLTIAIDRDSLANALVRAALVEVGRVLERQTPEMILVEYDQMVEHLAPEAANKSLRDGVHVGRPDCDLDDLRTGTLRHVVESRTELVVTVSDKDLRCVAPHGRVAQLLSGPVLRGVSGRGHVDHPSGGEVHDEEGEDLPEEDIVGLDEVARPDQS